MASTFGHADEETTRRPEIGLALSGGGFRATLFHVGALRRLVELGILTRVDRISSVSGGSIVAGRLAQVWKQFAAAPTVAAYDALIAEPLRAFCRLSIDTKAGIGGLADPFHTAGEKLEAQYQRHIVSLRLDQLPDAPVFVFNATNLESGRSFRFTKDYLADWRIGLMRDPRLPVARAVAASSAFPPAFSPVVLDKPGVFEMVPGADLNGNPAYTQRINLADGGVYDNLGLETVGKRCATVLVSDAGAPFSVDPETSDAWLRQTMRVLDVATDQARALRKRALLADFQTGGVAGTYWGIDTDIADYELSDALPCKPALAAELAAMRTRLDPFNETEQGRLINWGYALTDAAIRRWAPQLVVHMVPRVWPCPLQALG